MNYEMFSEWFYKKIKQKKQTTDIYFTWIFSDHGNSIYNI